MDLTNIKYLDKESFTNNQIELLSYSIEYNNELSEPDILVILQLKDKIIIVGGYKCIYLLSVKQQNLIDKITLPGNDHIRYIINSGIMNNSNIIVSEQICILFRSNLSKNLITIYCRKDEMVYATSK